MRLPKIIKEIKTLEQESANLQYQITYFESPDHLLQLAQAPQYAHLKFPLLPDVLALKEGLALNVASSDDPAAVSRRAGSVIVAARNLNLSQ